MKINLIISILIITGIIVFTSQGCKKDNSPETKDFIINVDSIVHADTIDSTAVLEVFFYGKIGDNECFAFKEFTPVFGLNKITVTVVGEETLKNDCSGGPVYLDGKGVGFYDLTKGNWTINVIEPEGGTPIESDFYVK